MYQWIILFWTIMFSFLHLPYQQHNFKYLIARNSLSTNKKGNKKHQRNFHCGKNYSTTRNSLFAPHIEIHEIKNRLKKSRIPPRKQLYKLIELGSRIKKPYIDCIKKYSRFEHHLLQRDLSTIVKSWSSVDYWDISS